MNSLTISEELIMLDEDYQITKNPFYQLALCVNNTRMKMFEIVEIPHLYIDMNNSFFSYDMQCIKKAHQYMKQSISYHYYNEIKKTLQKLLGILIQQQQKYMEYFKVYGEVLNQQDETLIHLIVNQLSHYFSNPNTTSFSPNNTNFSSNESTVNSNIIGELSPNKLESLSPKSSNNEGEQLSPELFALQSN